MENSQYVMIKKGSQIKQFSKGTYGRTFKTGTRYACKFIAKLDDNTAMIKMNGLSYEVAVADLFAPNGVAIFD